MFKAGINSKEKQTQQCPPFAFPASAGQTTLQGCCWRWTHIGMWILTLYSAMENFCGGRKKNQVGPSQAEERELTYFVLEPLFTLRSPKQTRYQGSWWSPLLGTEHSCTCVVYTWHYIQLISDFSSKNWSRESFTELAERLLLPLSPGTHIALTLSEQVGTAPPGSGILGKKNQTNKKKKTDSKEMLKQD